MFLGGKNSNGLLFSEAINDFRIHLEATGRSANTISNYLRSLEWLIEILYDIPLKKITSKDISLALVEIKKSSHSVMQRSIATMNRIICAYRVFFKWAFDSSLTISDHSISLHLKKVYSAGAIPISFTEIGVFFKTIQHSKDPKAFRDELLFSVYAFTGIRRSEALQLRIKDYDTVSSSLLLNHTKGGSKRRQPVPSLFAEILDRYISTIKAKGDNIKELPLFPGRYSETPLSKRQANARFEKWKRLSGIRKNLTIHSFRAGFASHLYNSSKDIIVVARAMGHRNIRTTDKYISNDPLFIYKAIEDAFGHETTAKIFSSQIL